MHLRTGDLGQRQCGDLQQLRAEQLEVVAAGDAEML
jgi:hypothetical protein